MSGFGERFRKEGYDVPKPLIKVDGKPIIHHVVDMFPGDNNFVFICNSEHLNNESYQMEEILKSIKSDCQIISIEPHKLGPVHAVMLAEELIDMQNETIVNYCDFCCYWDFEDFSKKVKKFDVDGAIPAYKGFHPHTLWSNYYAYLKEENSFASDIQEKTPFTDSPTDEYASSGTYYFRNGSMMIKYFKKMIDANLMVSNEYYVSMAYKPMFEDDLKVLVYELEHFMQWGTPQDLEEYNYWSNIFLNLSFKQDLPKHHGYLMVPMVGNGSRFFEKGFKDPKPLIKTSKKAMALNALEYLPITDEQRFVLRKDLNNLDTLKDLLINNSKNPSFSILNKITDGQASTCVYGAEDLNNDLPITISACDNGMLYSSKAFDSLFKDNSIDVIVWTAKKYPGAIRNPKMYGWVDTYKDKNLIKNVSVKEPLGNPKDDLIVVGTFTFKKLEYLFDSVKRMKDRKGLINGEYYVDTCINDCIEMGLKCVSFEIDSYICWGTPNDLATYHYWESCFDKWNSHPFNK